MDIVVRTTVIFFFVSLCLRALGKRELAEMTAFELVLIIVMGDIVQPSITQQDISLAGSMMGVGTITLWILFTSYISFRFKRARPVIEGVPAVVVQNGRPNEQVIRIERLTLDEVYSAAREQGIASLSDVRLAILEPEGHFTFIQRSGEQTSAPEHTEP
jgi:uncharacterized membrane protein YcaP (DUF421 family)